MKNGSPRKKVPEECDFCNYRATSMIFNNATLHYFSLPNHSKLS